jgi:phosphoribosylpyrophosphate synthetase
MCNTYEIKNKLNQQLKESSALRLKAELQDVEKKHFKIQEIKTYIEIKIEETIQGSEVMLKASCDSSTIRAGIQPQDP